MPPSHINFHQLFTNVQFFYPNYEATTFIGLKICPLLKLAVGNFTAFVLTERTRIDKIRQGELT